MKKGISRAGVGFFAFIFLLLLTRGSGLSSSIITNPDANLPEPGTVIQYYVAKPPAGNDNNNGLNPNSPFATIQHAINTARGDVTHLVIINVAAGYYVENLTMHAWESLIGGWNEDFSQRWDFKNDGVEPPNEFSTVIDGNSAAAITIHEITSPVKVDGFWIQYGSSEKGGGISINQSTAATIVNCGMSVNHAVDSNYGIGHGGAISNVDSYSKISNCLFMANESQGGGGAIANFNSACKITNCIFERNTAGMDGGAIYNIDAWAVIENSVFFNNHANIYNGRGGAIFNDHSTIEIVNSTFYGNQAGQDGGAISSYGSPQPIIITNSILWGDSAPTGTEIFDFVSTTIVAYSNIMGGYNGDGNISHDPKFIDPINRKLQLQQGSKCIDSGTSEGALEFDIEGKFRWDDPGFPNSGDGTPDFYDMGAYEYHPDCFGDFNRDGDVDGDDLGFFKSVYSNGDGWGDLNSDGTHNWIDVGILANEYGRMNCLRN